MRRFERFTVIPAIDLKGGRVVRLRRGDMESATVYGDDPAEVARRFEAEGAEQIHIVDLDGAVSGSPRHLREFRAIRRAVRCRLDLSGGLRTIEAVREAVDAGADFVALGSAAVLAPELIALACGEFPGRVLGSLDARDGRLAIRGWVETSPILVTEAAQRFVEAGVAALILTDIARDGTESGANAPWFADAARQMGVALIASGGIAALSDIRALAKLFDEGVEAVIVGRALYEGRFTMAAAAEAVRTVIRP